LRPQRVEAIRLPRLGVLLEGFGLGKRDDSRHPTRAHLGRLSYDAALGRAVQDLMYGGGETAYVGVIRRITGFS
jgi:hypothetical protein